MSEEIIRIMGSARIKARSDTLENWRTENPVLLSGEPGVVTDGTETEKIKFGDGKTNWNDLPYWKGPKGEKGDIGPQGEKGEQGKDAETDQVFNPNSEKAQSGKAVAEAIKGLQKYFADVEISEDNLAIVLKCGVNTAYKIISGQIILEDVGGSVRIENGVLSVNSDKNQMDFVSTSDYDTPIPIKIGTPIQEYHAATKDYVDTSILTAIGQALEGDY